nr:SDR family oxidoreductase [Prescottella equi]
MAKRLIGEVHPSSGSTSPPTRSRSWRRNSARSSSARPPTSPRGPGAAAVAVAVERFGALDLAFNVAVAARGGMILVSRVRLGLHRRPRAEGRVPVHETRCPAHGGERAGGAIVNIASFNAPHADDGAEPVRDGQAGSRCFSKNAALELSQHGIRVNAVLRDSSTPHSSRASPAGSRC